jgi:hypothetical protein
VVAAGFLGSSLNCDDSDCEGGSPSWLQPWTWGDHYFYPEAFFVGVAGLVAGSGFVFSVFRGRKLRAALFLAGSIALLSYPFFAGLTSEGRALFSFGPLLGFAALAFMLLD